MSIGSLSFQRCPEIGDHADFKRLLIQNMVTKNKKHLCQNFQLMDNGRLMIERQELEKFFRLYHEIVVKKSKSKNDLSWFFIETPRIVDQGKSDKGSLNGLHRMFMDLDIMLKMENKDDFNQIYFDNAVNGIVKILSKATYNKALPPTALANDSENVVKHDYHDKLKMSRIVIRDSLPSVKEINNEKFLKIGVHLVWPNLITRAGRDENNQFYSEMYHSVYSNCGGAKGPHFQEIEGVKKYSWDKDTSGDVREIFTFDTSVLTSKDSKLRMPYSFKAEECKECRRKPKNEADICVKCFGTRRVACLERGVYRPTRDIQMKMDDENGDVKAVITEYCSRLGEKANECTFEEFRSSVIHPDLKICDLTKDPASGISNEEMDKYIFTLSEDKCDILNYDTKKRKRKLVSRNRVGTRKTDYLNTLNMAKNDTKRRRIKGYQEIQIQEFERTKELILNQVIMKFDYKVHKSLDLKIQVYGDLQEGGTTPFGLKNVQFNYMTEDKVIQALKAEISRKNRGMDLSQLKNQLSTFAEFKKIVKSYFNCNGNDQNGDSPPPYMIQIRTDSRLCVVKFKSELNKIIYHTHTENVKPMHTLFVKIINLTFEWSNKSTITPWGLKDMGLKTAKMLFEMYEKFANDQIPYNLNNQRLSYILELIKLHNLKLKDTKEKIISFFDSVEHNSNCVKLTLAPEFDFDNHPSPKVEEKCKNDKLKICGWYLYFGCWSQSGVCSSKRGFKKKHHLKKLDLKKYKDLNDQLTTHFENVCKGNDQIFHDITVQAIASKLK
jgi:hypothetical protein